MSGICKDRVVFVTGAGGGLGRAYALALAAEGALVVVNDVRRDAAEAVVAEIAAAGGRARADSSDITNYQDSAAALRDTVDAFGGLHALINNAGICRDRMFASLSEEEWDAVIAVHLKGHFCLASNAAKHWRGLAKAGRPVAARIINTSSGAGLQGSVGQSNYAAAKGGIASLTLVQAVELARYGVTVNALAPAARTGMTEAVFADRMRAPEEGFDYYDPANVAPLVVWLVSEQSSGVSGHIFEVEGGKLSIADGWRRGPEQDKGARWEPGEIGAAVQALLQASQPAQPVYGS